MARYDASLADEIKALRTRPDNPISPQQIKDFLIATRRFEAEFLGPKHMTYAGSITAVKLALERVRTLGMYLPVPIGDNAMRSYGAARVSPFDACAGNSLRPLLAALLFASGRLQVPFDQLPEKLQVR